MKKGITLISLVITIVIILILAGVGIYGSLVLIEEAKYSAFINEMKQVDEAVAIYILEKELESVEAEQDLEIFTDYLTTDEIAQLPQTVQDEINYIRKKLEGTLYNEDDLPSDYSYAVEIGEGKNICYLPSELANGKEETYIYDEQSASVYKVEPTIIWGVEMHGYEYGNLLTTQSGLLERAQKKEEYRKYLYKAGDECIDITGGYEQVHLQEEYNNAITGILRWEKYDNFMKLYSTASGSYYGAQLQIKTKNYINKENYKFLTIEMKAENTDEYSREMIWLEDTNGNTVYNLNLNSQERIDRKYLQIPLKDINNDFAIGFYVSSYKKGEFYLSIYNIFLTNETDLGEIKKTEIPQGLDKAYILQGNNEFENYTGGYNKRAIRYYVNNNSLNYTGTSHIDVIEDRVELYAVSNGSGYGTSVAYITDNYLNKGQYTKLNVELEATSNDNYNRFLIWLTDMNGNTLYQFLLNAKDVVERQVIQIDLAEITEEFKVSFACQAVSGGSVTNKVYSAYFSN